MNYMRKDIESYKRQMCTPEPRGCAMPGACAALEQIGLNKVMNDVAEFHKATDTPVCDTPFVPNYNRQDLRLKLIEEEFIELVEAMEECDLPNIAKEASDLIYVIAGMALEYGIDLEKMWNAVHQNNMTKVDPVTGKVLRREDGKVIKPAGYTKLDADKVFWADDPAQLGARGE